MKKKYKISALVIFVIIFSSGCDKNPAEYLKLKSVKIAEGSESGGEKSLEDLRDEAKEYEDDINTQVQASAKLGPVYEKLVRELKNENHKDDLDEFNSSACCDLHSRFGADRQVRQHVASADRAHQEVFRVVQGCVAAIGRCCTDAKGRFAGDRNGVLAAVAVVGGGGAAGDAARGPGAVGARPGPGPAGGCLQGPGVGRRGWRGHGGGCARPALGGLDSGRLAVLRGRG